MASCLNIVHFIYKRNPAMKKNHKRKYKIKNPILCYKPITRREGEEGGQEKKVKRRARVGKRDTQLSYCYGASVERRLGWSLDTQSENSIQNDMGCQFLLQLTYMSLLCSDVITHHVWSMIGRGPMNVVRWGSSGGKRGVTMVTGRSLAVVMNQFRIRSPGQCNQSARSALQCW